MKVELLDKTKIEVVAYNEIADFCLRYLKKKDIIIIYGEIEEGKVRIKQIEYYLRSK